MGGMTQTLTGAAMTENYEDPKKSLIDQMSDNIDPGWSEPASRSDLRNALVSIDSKFDSLRNYIDSQAFKTTQK